MRILFVTDLHDVRAFLPALVAAERGADLCLLGGDLTNFAGAVAARAVLAPLRRAFGEVRAVPGNVDRPEVTRLLEDEGLSLHGRGEALDGVWLSGVGGSNHTPLRAPTEYSEETLATLLAAGAPSPEALAARTWILVTHVPPRDTVADRMFTGRHVGSTALRAFLEGAGPALNLCGHIHEGVGQDRVAETTVCNPGAFTAARYAVISVEGGQARAEARQLPLGRALRARATAQMVASKVAGYARHRLGR